MPELNIAPGLSLPIDGVTETFAIVAKRGTGKTHNASVLGEEMLKAGEQIVVLDPTDVWWGMRSSADGTGDGLPIYVFGGDHADVPLEATGGALLADVVVDHGISAILSLRHFSEQEMRRFVGDFGHRLYDRKGKAQHRSPLHLFIDEADEFAPQRLPRGGERMFGAIDRLVRRGRASGVGVTLISQRPQVINKDVLTQCEVLIAMQLTHALDRKAVDAWVEAHDVRDQRAEFMASLASLGIGEAWVWSPGWLDIFQRVQFRRRETFDSSATPKRGEHRAEPRRVRPLDLGVLRERMSETLERAKADDPRELRRQITALKAQLSDAPTAEPIVERIEVPIVTPEQTAALDLAVRTFGEAQSAVLAALEPVRDSLREIGLTLAAVQANGQMRAAVAQRSERRPHKPQVAGSTPARSTMPAPSTNGTGAPLKKGARRMLATLAAFQHHGLTREQLGTLANVQSTGGTFSAYLSSLRQGEYINEAGEFLTITAAGLAIADDSMDVPTNTTEVVDAYRQKLKAGARRMLDVLVIMHPDWISRTDLGERAAVSVDGGTFSAYLSSLRRNGLIEEDGGLVRAGPALYLFEEGA